MFGTYGPLGDVLNFILSFNSYRVNRLLFPQMTGEERPHFFAPTDPPNHRFARGTFHGTYFHVKMKNPDFILIASIYEAYFFI